MKTVRVLLREDVDPLGRIGDVVEVASGYARNYLVPRRMAVEATEDNVRAMQRRRERVLADEATRSAEHDARLEALQGVEVSTEGKADEGGHLYGSVTAAQIAALLEQAGHPVGERAVRLEAPIKSVGRHDVQVHVHGDKHATVVVEVRAAGA